MVLPKQGMLNAVHMFWSTLLLHTPCSELHVTRATGSEERQATRAAIQNCFPKWLSGSTKLQKSRHVRRNTPRSYRMLRCLLSFTIITSALQRSGARAQVEDYVVLVNIPNETSSGAISRYTLQQRVHIRKLLYSHTSLEIVRRLSIGLWDSQ